MRLGQDRRPQALRSLGCAPTYFPLRRTASNFSRMERRNSERRPPSYTPDDIASLRITRVHFRQDYIFFLLLDGKVLCVPLGISSALEAAPRQARYQWQITGDGKAVVWHTKGTVGVPTERLELTRILAHPEAYVTDLPGSKH
jgi:hypothetical protein